jgi:NitT/TauT family transport system substrate-binding protein
MRSLKRLAFVVATAVMAATPAFAQTKLNAGYVTATDFVPLLIAKEKGFFAKHGLEVEPKRIPIITNIPPALISGDLQIGAATMPLLLQANDGGLDIRLVAGAARHLKETSKIALVVRSGLKIDKPADLKGKKIGVAGFNSTMDVFLRKWLTMKGVNPKEVTFVEAQFPQMPDLLRAGTVDAVTITEPLKTIALKQGVGYSFADYAAEVNPDVLMVGYIATGDWVSKNAAAVAGFRAAMDEAIAFAKANPDAMHEVEKRNLGFMSNGPTAFNTAIRPTDLDVYIAMGKELGLYRSKLDPAKLIVK